MKQWKRVTAIMLSLFLIVTSLPQNFSAAVIDIVQEPMSIAANETQKQTSNITIDGNGEEWNTIPGVLNVTKGQEPFAGAYIDSIKIANDKDTLYLKVEGTLQNWGESGMFIDLALDVSGKPGTNSASPWGAQYNFNTALLPPSIHVLARHSTTEVDGLQYAEVKKENEPVLTSNEKREAFSIGLGSGIEENGAYGTILTAEIPMDKVEVVSGDAIRVIGVISGNNDEHGAFAVYPRAIDNEVAADYNSTANQQSLSTYTDAYMITDTDSTGVTDADYVELTSGYHSLQNTRLGDISLYSDGRDLYFYAETPEINAESAFILGIENGSDTNNTIGAYDTWLDVSSLTKKPQYYLQYHLKDKSSSLYSAKTNAQVTDETGIIVNHTETGIEGKIPLSALSLKADDSVQIFGILADMTSNTVYSVVPVANNNSYTTNESIAKIGTYSNSYQISSKEAILLTPDTFKDLGGEEWYIRGGITSNGWENCTELNKMSRVAGNLYAASYVLEAGAYEFKPATDGWNKDIGANGGNFKITLSKKSKITIYIRTEEDMRKAWVCGMDETGTKLDSSILTMAGETLKLYEPSYLEEKWPRLVGDIQTALGEASDWSPEQSKLFMYDYNMDGSEYWFECTLPSLDKTYSAKAVCGTSWQDENYGSDKKGGANLELSLSSTSKVIFKLNLASETLSAAVEALELKAVQDFALGGIKTDKKVFTFTFNDIVTLEDEKTIADSIVFTPEAAIKSVELSSDKKQLVVTLSDSELLKADTKYTILLKEGFFKSSNGTKNKEGTYSFITRLKETGEVKADEFVGLESSDTYVVTGNFQKLAGDSGDWQPSSKHTQMKRVTGNLYAYSVVLPATKDAGISDKTYQFKVVKNGDYDDVGSFGNGTGSYGNYEFTLEEESKLTIFINTETQKLFANVDIATKDGSDCYYYYNSENMPRLTGEIQTMFDSQSGYETSSLLFYDYYCNGSEYRLERKLKPNTSTITAKAQEKKNNIITDIGEEITIPALKRAMDTTFTIKDSVLSYEFNVYTPKLSIDTAPENMQKGSEYQFSASFIDEYKESSVPDRLKWSMKAPAEGIAVTEAGLVTIDEKTEDNTTFTIVVTYQHTSDFAEFNQTYEAEFTVTVVPVVTNFTFHYLRKEADYSGWNLWVWLDGQEGSGYYVLSEKDGWYSGVVSIPEKVDKINFITRKGEWSDQEGGNRVFDLTKGSEIWLVQGDRTVYYSKEEAMQPKIFSAIMNSKNTVDFTISDSDETISYSNFTITANGKAINTVTRQTGENAGTITLLEEIQPSDLIEVIDITDTYSKRTATMRKILDSYYYDGDDLGYTKQNGIDTFKVWAPTAVKVGLALYHNEGIYNEAGVIADQTPDYVIEMEKDLKTGVFSVQTKETTGYSYYMYQVEFVDGTINYAVDPYARAVSANGQRTAIVDLTATNPKVWKPNEKPATINYATDHILYELQVRDFSMDKNAPFKNKGKYLAFTETGLQDSAGNPIGIDHLQKLGITTVHLLPAYDFGSINELKVDDETDTGRKYNWGYDPQNYNVPEGSYSSDPKNPTARITEFKAMVQALHDAGIRVVMDVVYNHTLDITDGPFNKIVPGYYYRVDSVGEFSNGSGCGNEVASENPMVQKYIIDSVKYWAKEYNIDGFRFDLFGLIDQDTAERLTRELQEEIDPTILVYGEPWTGGATPLKNGVNKGAQKDKGYAVFNDNIRGAIKGGSDDASKGFATGESGKEKDVEKGILGSISDFTNAPTETINYVTAHDNLNLWDKIITTQGLNEDLNMLYGKILDGAMKDGSSVLNAVAAADPYKYVKEGENVFENETVRRSLLANTMVITMQGIPFIHAGDELLRTKYGDHNSYRSPDEINMIRWENAAKFSKVTDYYAGLIELRKTHPAFRMDTKEAVLNNLVVCRTDGNVIVYVLKNHANGDSFHNIVVIYNANPSDQIIDLGQYTDTKEIENWNIIVNDKAAGVDVLSTTGGKSVTVPGISTMILYDTETSSSDEIVDFIPAKDNVTLTLDQQMELQIIYKNEIGSNVTGKQLNVSSSNQEVAEVFISDEKNYSKIKLVGKNAGTAQITLTAKNEKTQEDIVKTIQVTVAAVKVNLSPETANYHMNPVLSVDTKGLEIRSVIADLSEVGGSSHYEVSPITKEISFGIKDYITQGEKTIPVTITDGTGKQLKLSVNLTVTQPDKGMDWDEAVIYFMLTDRFFDGNESNNGVLVNKEDKGAYHGGDFAGVTQKLSYLKELGINTIWLTPIVENTEGNWSTKEEKEKGNNYYAYHGYWASDFKELNPYLGTKEELCTLIEKAHDLGIKIMVDVVLNHAGYYDETTSIDEEILGMLRDNSIADGEEKNWISGLPDFETENQEVREKLIGWQSAWANLKTERGDSIDYFRVDTVKHVDHETWKQFKTELAKNNSEFKLIGEIFDTDSKINEYLNNGEMDAALDFNFKNIVRRFVVDGELEAAERELEERNSKITNTAVLGQFLSSHDEDGFLSEVLLNDKDKMMIAATLQMTAKGQPVIYYGEEIGLSGKNNWPLYDNRRDFDWNLVENNTMYAHYKKLLELRNKYSKLFAKGNRSSVAGSDEEGYLVFARNYQTQQAYIAVNTKNTPIEATFTVNLESGDRLLDEYSNIIYSVSEDKTVTIKIPAMKDGGSVILYPMEKELPNPDVTPTITPEPTTPPTPTITPDPTTTPTPTIIPDPTTTPTPTIIPDPTITPSPTKIPTPIPNNSDTTNNIVIGNVTEEITSKTEGDLTIETTVSTIVDTDGNKTEKVVKVEKQSDGEIAEQTTTITYENKKDGIGIVVETRKDKKGNITKNEAVVEVLKSTAMSEKDTTKILANIPEQILEYINKVAGISAKSQELPVTILLPEQNIIDCLSKTEIKKAEVIIKQPKELINSAIKIVSLQLGKDTIRMAKQKGKTLSVVVTNQKDKPMYEWIFEKNTLENSTKESTDINLYLELDSMQNFFDVKKEQSDASTSNLKNSLKDIKQGISLHFNHDGVLPTTAKLKVYPEQFNLKLEKEEKNKDSVFYLYHYNEETKKLDILPENEYKMEEDYITLQMVHCSDYVLLNQQPAKETVTDLLSQITIPFETTLYVGGTVDNTADLTKLVKLPATLSKVELFGEHLLQPAMAEVKLFFEPEENDIISVSETGKVTAKQVGMTEVKLTAQLADGTRKEYKIPVNVKKATIQFIKNTPSVQIGETGVFEVALFGFKPEDIIWSTKTNETAIVEQNQGKTKVEVTGRYFGKDYVIVSAVNSNGLLIKKMVRILVNQKE